MSLGRAIFTTIALAFVACTDVPVALDPDLEPAFVVASVFTSPLDFEDATALLGVPTVIHFEDIDASPINDTYVGRTPFNGSSYAAQGVTFSNQNDYPLYISPTLLPWNASNSLSVGRFPFDPAPLAFNTDDDLTVTLNPSCRAVGFTLVDNSGFNGKFVQFLDFSGQVVEQVGFPGDFEPFRAFLGIVSLDSPIATINIEEAASDFDDVNYDDFICFPGAAAITVDIDVKPGSDPNSITCNDEGVSIPVAILSTDDFDATTVDHTTVTFEGASETHVDRRTGVVRRHEEDVDGDGDTDLVLHFRVGDTRLDCDSTDGTLVGETFDGDVIIGTDAVAAVVLAPSDSKIVFVSQRDGLPGSEVYAMNGDGSGQTRLTDDTDLKVRPRWSPDGKKIAFSRLHNGDWDIWIMNEDGSGQTNVTNGPGRDIRPDWSPDGEQLVYHSGVGQATEIYVTNADGSGTAAITTNGTFDGAASFSPNGEQIVFMSRRGGNLDIYVMNADGSGEIRLTTDPASDGGPRWSPDGTQIAFSSDRDGDDDVWVMNADGSELTNITDNEGISDIHPSWSPNGQRLAFGRSSQIYVMNADGSAQTSLTNDSAFDGHQDSARGRCGPCTP